MNMKCNCAMPNANGWHVSDEVITTFGTLKQAQNESAEEVAQWIAHIFFTKTEKTFYDLMLSIVDGEFKGSYSRLCEWQNPNSENYLETEATNG